MGEKASKDKSDRKDRDRERQPKSAIAFHSTQKKSRTEHGGNIDADDPIEDESDDSSEEEDDDDNTAVLMAELQRIRAERAAEAAKKEIEQRQEEERIRTEIFLVEIHS